MVVTKVKQRLVLQYCIIVLNICPRGVSAQSQRGACTSLMYRSLLQRQPKGRMKRSQAKCQGSYIDRVQKNTLVIHAETCMSIIDLELNKRTNYALTHLWNIQNK